MGYATPKRRMVMFITGLSLVLAMSPTALAEQGQEKADIKITNNSKFERTAFTYQGQLRDTDGPVNGSYDLQFNLYSAQTGGEPLESVDIVGLSLTNGLFSVRLDFDRPSIQGGTLNESQESWIEIKVRAATSTEPCIVLSPRQKLTPTPYAIFAQHEQWSLIGVPVGFQDRSNQDREILGEDEKTADAELNTSKVREKVRPSPPPNAPEKSPQQGSVSGGGTTGTIPRWTGATALGNSGITQDNAGNVAIGMPNPQRPAKLSSIDSATEGDNSMFYAAVFGQSNKRFGVVGLSGEGTGVSGLSGGGVGVEGTSNSDPGVSGESKSGPGVRGESTTGAGVEGVSNGRAGVSGSSQSGIGVEGTSTGSDGVHGTSKNNGAAGVFGSNDGGTGLSGISTSGTGARGKSKSSIGVLGESDSNNGVEGRSMSGVGVRGASTGDVGVKGTSTSTFGVQGEGTNAAGVRGISQSGNGVFGTSTSGVGAGGISQSGNGVQGESESRAGVAGKSTSAQGVVGLSASGNGVEARSESRFGVQGVSNSFPGVAGESTSAFGVQGIANGSLAGVAGFSTTGFGVQGLSTSNAGVHGESASGRGLEGKSTTSEGVVGVSTSGVGVGGVSRTNRGVEGQSTEAAGVVGITMDSGKGGVVGGCPAQPCNAVVSVGDLLVQGKLLGGAKLFHIDHPLDPANKYLNHASVESSEMKNIYDGVAALDSYGVAIVELPEWFAALNIDYRYQLTCIGGFAPVYIAEKIKNNRFKIAGGLPGLEVSWQVTGIRHDAWANAHRLVVEEDKLDNERGYYLNPELFGELNERGIMWLRYPDLMQQMQMMKQGQLAAPERVTPTKPEPFR